MRISSILVLALLATTALTALVTHGVSAASSAPAQVAITPVTPASCPRPAVTGIATFYGQDFQDQPMANGEPFDMHDPATAASNRWPLGTRLRLHRLPGSPWDTTLTAAERMAYRDRDIVVTVTDRGNFTHALDLSAAAFALLGRPDEGVIRVAIQPLAPCG